MENFIEAVRKMRVEQIAFFKSRSSESLKNAIEYEKVVDDMLVKMEEGTKIEDVVDQVFREKLSYEDLELM